MSLSVVNVGAQAASNSSPQTATLPASHAANDWLLLFCTQMSASGITFTPPAGYNSVARNSNVTRTATIEVFAKLDNGSESNPSVGVSSAAGGWTVQMMAVRGGNRSTFTDATAVLSDAAAAMTFQPTQITTAADGAMVISFATTKDDNALNYSNQNSFTNQMSGANYDSTTGNGSDESVGVATIIKATHGAQTMPTWNQSTNGTDAWVALSLAVKPAVDQLVTPGVLTQTLTEYAPTVTRTNNQLVTPGTLSLISTKYAVVLQIAITPAQTALLTSKFVPILNSGIIVPKQTVNLTSYASIVYTPQVFIANVANALLASFAPSVAVPRLCVPDLQPLALATYAPIIVSGNSLVVTPDIAALISTTFTPNVLTTANSVVIPSTTALLTDNLQPNVSLGINLSPLNYALTATRFVPDIGVSGGGTTVVVDTNSLVLTSYYPLVSMQSNEVDTYTRCPIDNELAIVHQEMYIGTDVIYKLTCSAQHYVYGEPWVGVGNIYDLYRILGRSDISL